MEKEMFVKKLGELLSCTREQIKGCVLADNETVVIEYENGNEQSVCIACDSYTAIIKDVVNAILL